MSTTFAVPIYQRKVGSRVDLVTLGLGAQTLRRAADGLAKAEEQLLGDLRDAVTRAKPAELLRFDLKRGTRLERVRIELTLKDAKKRSVSGLCPLIVEPRHTGGDPLRVCYHPFRQAEWFPLLATETLADSAAAYFAGAWQSLGDDEIRELFSNARDSLRILAFHARPKTLLEELPSRRRGVWDDLEIDPTAKKNDRKTFKVLPSVGTDLTASRTPPRGLPRAPYREQLAGLFGGERRQSVMLVGPPGSGKSALIEQLVADLLTNDGYEAHQNIDRVTHVWRTHGRQLIAGMSRVGEWEQRCVDLASDVRGRKIVLLVPDIALFGRIGRAKDSHRALSDFFRGPVARGEVVMLGECTREQLKRLEEDDPAFASAFVKVHVEPATRGETFRMMLARARAIEVASPRDAPVSIEPRAFQTILELAEGLYPAQALPGKAVDLLVRVASARRSRAESVGPNDVLEHLSRDTGLPWVLLSADKPLAVEEVVAELRAHVMGQDDALREVADLVVRIRTGLTDPKRPYGVYLFTGPTGTGKTELAKALAQYLYGSSSRLLRFDMSELSGPDAVARLIGDAWSPEGLLTSAALAQPFSVVLLDEIEKAHPAVLNLLLQLFDDGRLTDAAGTTASFTQSVVVMTSNLGARHRPPVGFGVDPNALMADVARAVREFFPPELFNRIDAVVPFRGLDAEVAVRITKKELSKLFARSGLVERNVFVEIGSAAIERIAEDALRAEDGARSLKRFLEDRIATLLAERIAESPGAAMQVLRIATTLGELVVESEPLAFAEPVGGRYALEGLWNEPMSELRGHLEEARATLERIEAGDGLRALGEELPRQLSEPHADRLYNLDWMRVTVARLRERVDRLLGAPEDLEHHAIETAIEQRESRVFPRRSWRAVSPAMQRPSRMRFDFGKEGSWWDVFSAIAETVVIERAQSSVALLDRHAVFVELVPFGAGRALLTEMLHAYAGARGEVDGVAWLTDGEVVSGRGLDLEDAKTVDYAVIKLVGLCIRDFLELETGTHVWHSSVREPELLRVRVVPAQVHATAKTQAEAFVRARAGGERADRLLPIVRVMHFDPPPPRRPPALLEMEDYVVGIPLSARVTRIRDVFAKLWLLRASRVPEEP